MYIYIYIYIYIYFCKLTLCYFIQMFSLFSFPTIHKIKELLSFPAIHITFTLSIDCKRKKKRRKIDENKEAGCEEMQIKDMPAFLSLNWGK